MVAPKLRVKENSRNPLARGGYFLLLWVFLPVIMAFRKNRVIKTANITQYSIGTPLSGAGVTVHQPHIVVPHR